MTDGKPNFEDFSLSEYSNIAQAYFKSIETISTFFRYYLLIMSIPISAIAVFSHITGDTPKDLSIVHYYRLPIFVVLFFISLIGFGIFCYVTNLRLDTILYARAVNAIRKFFYDDWDQDINLKLRIRTLPQSPQLPHYLEKSYFTPVVSVFGVMNSLYFFLAFNLYFTFRDVIGFTICFFLLHLSTYSWYTRHRETAYLKSNILGIDIDGVLNKHRERFCKLLFDVRQKKIKPEEIKIIPVHEDPDLNVTREDERYVFNDPTYWTDMYVIEDAAENIMKLRNYFKLKIYIFTYRPWPETSDKKALIESIEQFIQKCTGKNICSKLLLNQITLNIPILGKKLFSFKEKPLKKITRTWLKKHDIKYNKFIFEKGNDYSSDPRGQFNNRFYIGRKKKIRFFVEDDLEKAIKLSYICDLVFLFSQPYNEAGYKLPADIKKSRLNFPSNIIRVKSWEEIFRHMRRLS